MNVTAEERRNKLELFNVSEAARKLGIPVQQMHRSVKAGHLPRPAIRLGRRYNIDVRGDGGYIVCPGSIHIL